MEAKRRVFTLVLLANVLTFGNTNVDGNEDGEGSGSDDNGA